MTCALTEIATSLFVNVYQSFLYLIVVNLQLHDSVACQLNYKTSIQQLMSANLQLQYRYLLIYLIRKDVVSDM